jgi:hypothetical protein
VAIRGEELVVRVEELVIGGKELVAVTISRSNRIVKMRGMG